MFIERFNNDKVEKQQRVKGKIETFMIGLEKQIFKSNIRFGTRTTTNN